MAPAAPVPAPALFLRGAVALSGRFPLLAGVDLEVAPGEVVLVTGPNGAGKTSLLRVCAGLVPLTAGTVRVLGADPADVRTGVRRRIGFLAHASHLYDDLTVTENLRFAVRAAGGPVGGIGAACDRVGLAGRVLRTPAGKLSAGQRRRVALASLLARSPQLWLLDEPHAGLDAAARDVVGTLVAGAAASGATVVVASHEPELVAPLATRSITVAGGQVVDDRPAGPRPVGSSGPGVADVA